MMGLIHDPTGMLEGNSVALALCFHCFGVLEIELPSFNKRLYLRNQPSHWPPAAESSFSLLQYPGQCLVCNGR